MNVETVKSWALILLVTLLLLSGMQIVHLEGRITALTEDVADLSVRVGGLEVDMNGAFGGITDIQRQLGNW